MGSLSLAVAAAGLLPGVFSPGCAAPTAQQPQQTIEPPTGSARGGAASTAPENGSDFVLSREPVAPEQKPREQPIHIGDKWWKFRGDFLKLGEAQVRDRDASVPGRQAPTDFWDPQTALESVSVWSALCNQCHGGRRRLEDALSMPAPPANWGQGEGLFFGNRRPYSDVFSTIHSGGPEKNGKRAMPAWKNILAREQIWALLYFLEFQSGGIEGRFPPSLYPRMRGNIPGGQGAE